MECPSTPPRGRLRTPPTPLHGPSHDDFVPYSPRRSSRKTLNTNPYSTTNSFANKLATSSTPATKPAIGLGFAPSDCFSSPPASPINTAAEMRKSSLMTPRRVDNSSRNNSVAGGNDFLDPSTSTRKPSMLLTPTKTPTTMTPARKHSRAASMQDTARVLHFQPDDPNDNMPTRHQSRSSARSSKFRGLDLDSNGIASSSRQNNGHGTFEIYTESHARVPQLDTSGSNPFFRPRANTIPPMTCQSPPLIRKKTMSRIQEEGEIDDAAARNEGIMYTFRGRKVFKKFDDFDDNDADTESDARDPSATFTQRALRRSAGAAAQRPLTRSQIKPRLLFPPDSQPLHSYTDEEAETDIEPTAEELHTERQRTAPETVNFSMPATPAKKKSAQQSNGSPPSKARAPRKRSAADDIVQQDDQAAVQAAASMPTPAQSSKKKVKHVGFADMPGHGHHSPAASASLPSPQRSSTRSAKEATVNLTPVVEEESEHEYSVASISPAEAFPRTSRSPFDHWPRTKGGLKREGDALPGASSKRTRSAAASLDA